MSGDFHKVLEYLSGWSRRRKICCLVLGGTDTGKTTLVTGLARRLADMTPTAVIDADIGQSHIGPPTTVGWALARKSPADLSEWPVAGMHFVGDIAPTRHLLQLTVALERSYRQAVKQARIVIIDTGGFIAGGAAQVLWWQVHRLLDPQVVVAVQRQEEMEPILAGLEKTTRAVWRLDCSEQVKTKSAEQRRNFRCERWAKYFHNHQSYEFSRNELSLQGAVHPAQIKAGELEGRVAALRDGAGCDKALGIIKEWSHQKGLVRLIGPPITGEKIRCLVIGDCKIEPFML